MKKTLYILLIIPFIIAILGFVNVVVLQNTMEVNLTSIDWEYNDNEAFKIQEEGYLLKATPNYDKNFKLASGNSLVWEVTNSNIDELSHASIEKEGSSYYLKAISEGDVIVKCRNEKNSISNTFNAHIYENGAIIINNKKSPSSSQMISKVRNYGEYDFNYFPSRTEKKKTELEFEIEVISDEGSSYTLVDKSFNITFNNGKITFLGSGEASFTLKIDSMPYITSTYNFNIVKDAVNVYSYKDLLEATNRSKEGEIVCLQTNLQSLDNTYKKDGEKYVNEYLKSNTKLFGNYNFEKNKFSFEDEIYSFETTYNHKYVKDYCDSNEGYSLKDYAYVKTGIHVQKDFYGNGFTINAHELAYPKNGKIDEIKGILTPSKDDLFKGPLTYVSLGKLDMPVIKIFGQDNSIMYVEGNNITIDDLRLQNINDTDNIYNLTHIGTSIDVKGSNITIKNSILRNGRDVLRVYSSPNFKLDNSLLQNARQFLLNVGSNEYYEVDKDVNVNVDTLPYEGSIDSYLNSESFDKFMYSIVNGSTDVNSSLKDLNEIQKSLDSSYKEVEAYNMEINDTYFSNSGLFSIAINSLFNGPYLYNGSPSFVKELISSLGVNSFPNSVGGISYPLKLKIKGDTRFYDYKDIDSIDASCLIEENLSTLLNEIFDSKITIDNFFPIKELLKRYVTSDNHKYSYKDNDKEYINPIICYYGGGKNYSSIDIDEITTNIFSEEIDIDFAKACLTGDGLLPSDNKAAPLLSRCIPMAAGTNEFRFITNGSYTSIPYLFNEYPNINDLFSRRSHI